MRFRSTLGVGLLTALAVLGGLGLANRPRTSPEQRALAQSLMQRALEEVGQLAEPQRRAEAVEKVSRALRQASPTGELSEEQKAMALEWLEQSLQDALLLAEDWQRQEAVARIVETLAPFDLDRALQMVEELEDPGAQEQARQRLIPVVAREDWPRAVALVETIADPFARAEAKRQLAQTLFTANLDRAQAQQLVREALALLPQIGNPAGTAQLRMNLAQTLAPVDWPHAEGLLTEALAQVEEVAEPGAAAELLLTAAALLAGREEARAAALIQQAAEREKEVVDPLPRAQLLLRCARAMAPFDLEQARKWLSEAAEIPGQLPEEEGQPFELWPQLILTGAVLSHEKVWAWSGQVLELAERNPDLQEFHRAMLEFVATVPLLATGDFARARDFMREQTQRGPYDALTTVWAALNYLWDHEAGRKLSEQTLARAERTELLWPGTAAALAVVPPLLYSHFLGPQPDLPEVWQLCDRAEAVLGTGLRPDDQTLGAGLLALATQRLDPDRARRFAGIAWEAFAAWEEDDMKRGLAPLLVQLLAPLDPDGAVAAAAQLTEPGARVEARLSLAGGLLNNIFAVNARGEILGTWK